MSKSSISLALLISLSLCTAGCGAGGGGGTDSTTVALSSADVGGDCDGAEPIPESLAGEWAETEQCTAMAAPAPNVIFSPTIECPRGHADACLATVPFFPCSDDPSLTCGAVGRFIPECNAIELPDNYGGAAAHEMIHYLLYTSGRTDWATHGSAEWVCQ